MKKLTFFALIYFSLLASAIQAQRVTYTKSENFKKEVSDSTFIQIMDTVQVALQQYQELADLQSDSTRQFSPEKAKAFKDLFLGGGTQLVFNDIRENCYSMVRLDDYTQDVRFYLKRGVKFSLQHLTLDSLTFHPTDSSYQVAFSGEKTVYRLLDKSKNPLEQKRTYAIQLIYRLPKDDLSKVKIDAFESECATLRQSTIYVSGSLIGQLNFSSFGDFNYDQEELKGLNLTNLDGSFASKTAASTGFSFAAMGDMNKLQSVLGEEKAGRLYWKAGIQYRTLRARGTLYNYEANDVLIPDPVEGRDDYQRTVRLLENRQVEETFRLNVIELPFGISYQLASYTNLNLFLDIQLHPSRYRMTRYKQQTNDMDGDIVEADTNFKSINFTVSRIRNPQAGERYNVGRHPLPAKNSVIDQDDRFTMIGFSITPKVFFNIFKSSNYELLIALPIARHPTLLDRTPPSPYALPLDFDYDEESSMWKSWEESNTRLIGQHIALRNIWSIGLQVGAVYKMDYRRFRPVKITDK